MSRLREDTEPEAMEWPAKTELKTKLAGRGGTAAGETKTTGTPANKKQTETGQRIVDGFRNGVDGKIGKINVIASSCARQRPL